MKEVVGIRINSLGFNPTKMGDLLYYEGPLLSHFIDSEAPGTHIFFRWVDCGEDAHRWLVFKANEKNLQAFFDGQVSLYQLILHNPTVLLVDLDADLEKRQILVSSTEALPEAYLPSRESFFRADHYTSYAGVLKDSIAQRLREQDLLNQLMERLQKLDERQAHSFGLLGELLFALRRQNNLGAV